MSRGDTDGPLIVYSDYVCPFCFLGKASLERGLEPLENPPDVEWRPFDLRGHKRDEDGTVRWDMDDGKDEAYFERARRNIERLKDEYDVRMTFDRSLQVDSWDAQKVALHVRATRGTEDFRSLHARLFRALWQEQRDIGDPRVLEELARDLGIDPRIPREALDDVALDDELRRRCEAARRRGISGIPTFVHGNGTLRGAVPPERIRRLLDAR